MRQSVRVRERLRGRPLLALNMEEEIEKTQDCKRSLKSGEGKKTFSPGTFRWPTGLPAP